MLYYTIKEMRKFYLSKLANTHDTHHKRFVQSSTGRLTGGDLNNGFNPRVVAEDIIRGSTELLYRFFENDTINHRDPRSRDIILQPLLLRYISTRRNIPERIYGEIMEHMVEIFNREQREYPLRNAAEREERRESVRENLRQQELRRINLENTGELDFMTRPWEPSSEEEGGDQDNNDVEMEEGGDQEEGGAQEEDLRGGAFRNPRAFHGDSKVSIEMLQSSPSLLANSIMSTNRENLYRFFQNNHQNPNNRASRELFLSDLIENYTNRHIIDNMPIGEALL